MKKSILQPLTFNAVLFAFGAFGARALAADVFTPVIASTVESQARPVFGTDSKYHLVYELLITNTKGVPADISGIDVLDNTDRSRVTRSYSGVEVLPRLRTLAPEPASDTKIEPNGGRLFYIELEFANAGEIPHALAHRLHGTGAANPGPSKPAQLDYVVAPLDIANDKPLVIGPPLAGKGWVAANGCCNPAIVHRGSIQSVNGRLANSQRFAIDWMRLDEQGRFVHGDASKVENYTDYGADVIAVADGKVVGMLNTLHDQVPGQLPDPSTITVETVDGNHVVLDLGGGYSAFYAHMQKGSVRVKPGDVVKRGAVLGKLGNSGNTSAPHLHFHIMNSPSPLGSNGLPYVLDHFGFAGQIDISAFGAAPGIEGDWGKGRLPQTQAREREFPLNLNIIDFGNTGL